METPQPSYNVPDSNSSLAYSNFILTFLNTKTLWQASLAGVHISVWEELQYTCNFILGYPSAINVH